MCKKLLIAAVAILVGVAVVKGTWLGSHLRLWRKQAQTWAQSQVKVETEIQRLRCEVERLEREDRVYFDKVARQRLDVRERETQLNKDKAELAVLQQRISQLRVALKGIEAATQPVVYNGASYKKEEAERQIDIDWARYEPLKTNIGSQERALKALREALAQNEKTLASFHQRRQEMLTSLQELETELGQIRMAQAARNTVFDDSKYGKVQRDIQALRQKLALEKEKLKLRGATDRGPIEQAEAERARKTEREKRMDAEFGPAQGKAPVVRQ
jgi:chromosome segregation ATPase